MACRATDERMSAEAFDALAKLCGLSRRGRGTLAIRAVLVEGVTREEAAREHGIGTGTIRGLLMRQRKRLQLVKQAAGYNIIRR